MKRRKIVSWLFWFCVDQLMVHYGLCEIIPQTYPEVSRSNNLAVTKFQNSLHEQNTYTILGSIEERLRNLDNIYSMQLAQNFETKLDQYNRKLENLDSKIIRLETIIMMNLGKISENISTKNYKDDISKTDTLRKLDSMYEGITHKLNYMERKLDTYNTKIQEKIEETFTHLDKMQKRTTKTDSDLETELSAVILAIDDLKKTYESNEQKVRNTTVENLDISKHTYNLLTKYNTDTRKFVNKLHDNIVGNLQYIDNRTTQQIKISDESNTFLKQMKIDLKEDLNDYAIKVANMNSDMWKSTDTTDDVLKSISLTVNNTKVELQNGVRSLMIQIGKISQKDNIIPSGNNYEELGKTMTENFDKILTNQDIFLESCHRLQMDESQIESEISVMLNKLIDMLEKKLATEARDVKNFEKNLKNHDNRINRNIYQINQNLITLFEKTNGNTENILSEIKKVGIDLKTLFSLVRNITNDESIPTDMIHTNRHDTSTPKILEKLNEIARSTRNLRDLISNYKNEKVSNDQIYKEVQNLSKSLSTAVDKIYNYTNNLYLYQNDSINTLESMIKKNIPLMITSPKIKPEVNDTIRENVDRIFGKNLNLNNQHQKKKCPQNIINLIDIRASGIGDCERTLPISTKKPKKNEI